MREFVAEGSSHLPLDVFRTLSKKIDAVVLGSELMICGFDHLDPNGYPHMFTVGGGTGIATDLFPLGWWAVGSGAMAAIGVLSQWQHNFGADTATTIYRLLEAKFAAESALGVGNARTFVLIQQYRSPFVMIDEATVQKVREIWKTKMHIAPPESLELLHQSIQAFMRRGLGR
jgi:hypothetical protein